MNIKFIAEITVKDVPPRTGRTDIEFEYEYGEPAQKSLDEIIDHIKTVLNRMGFEEKVNKLKKISISGL